MAKLRLYPEEQSYMIDWEGNEPYDVVYLRIESTMPTKQIHYDKLILEDGVRTECMRIYKSVSKIRVVKVMANTTYNFSLCLKEDGEIIDRQTEYWGLRMKMEMEYREDTDRIGRVYVGGSIQVPEKLFWLELCDAHVGLRFYLPPMIEDEGKFWTSCLVWKETYGKLRLRLDNKISDCFDIIKNER